MIIYDENGNPYDPAQNMSMIRNVSRIIPPYQLPEPPEQQSAPTYSVPPNIQSTVPQSSQYNLPQPQLTSAQQQYMGETAVDPNDPRYRHHGMRRVADILGTIGMGVAMGPGGVLAGKRLLMDSDYNNALIRQANERKLAESQGNIQKTEYAIPEGIAKIMGQLSNWENLGRYRDVTGEASAKRAETGAADVQSKIKRRESSIKFEQWKMEPKNQKKDDFQYIYEAPDDEERLARMESYKQFQEAKQKSDEKIQSEAEARARGAANVAVSPVGQQATRVTAQIRAEAGAEGRAAAPLTPDEEQALTSFVSRGVSNPDAINDIYKQVPNRLKTHFWSELAKNDIKIPRPLTTTMQTVVTNSKTAINHANSIRELVKDPDIQKAIGPIAGRLTEVGNIVGKSVYNSGPAAQKEAELLGLLRYLVTFEASSTSGTRPSWQLIRFLQSTSPATKMDEAKFQGALDAVIQSAGNRLAGVYGASSEGKSIPTSSPEKPKLGPVEWIKE